MAQATPDMILPGRVLHEDDDKIVLEIGKHDAVEFDVGSVPEEDKFYTIMFCRFVDGQMQIWKPWEEEGGPTKLRGPDADDD